MDKFLRIAKVIAVHPENYSVDVVCVDDNFRYMGVKVATLGASTNTGLVGLPVPTPPVSGDEWDQTPTDERDLFCVMAFAGSAPIVLGWLYPSVGQMFFDRPGFSVERHGSDVYKTISSRGDLEVSHPSSTFVRVAVDPAHEDLTEEDWDSLWKIKQNRYKAPSVRIEVGNALTVSPEGTVMNAAELAAADLADENGDPVQGTFTWTPKVTITLGADGKVTVQAKGAMTVTAPLISFNPPA